MVLSREELHAALVERHGAAIQDKLDRAAVGIAALFCGVTNCPLATVLLSIELFGGEGALFYMLAACISFLLSGCFSLYTGQHIVFSKLREEEIDARGH